MNKKRLINEFRTNCNNLIKGISLINSKLWVGNPYPIHTYFTLFNFKSIIDDDTIDEMSEIKIDGINIEKIKDTGWNCNTIRVSLKKEPVKNTLKKIKRTMSNLWFGVKSKIFFIPLISLKLFFKRNFGLYFDNEYENDRLNDKHFINLIRSETIRIEHKLRSANPNYKIRVLSDVECVGRFTVYSKYRYEGAGFDEYVANYDNEILNVPRSMIRKDNGYEETGFTLFYNGREWFVLIYIIYKAKNRLLINTKAYICAGIFSYLIYKIFEFLIGTM